MTELEDTMLWGKGQTQGGNLEVSQSVACSVNSSHGKVLLSSCQTQSILAYEVSTCSSKLWMQDTDSKGELPNLRQSL